MLDLGSCDFASRRESLMRVLWSIGRPHLEGNAVFSVAREVRSEGVREDMADKILGVVVKETMPTLSQGPGQVLACRMLLCFCF